MKMVGWMVLRWFFGFLMLNLRFVLSNMYSLKYCLIVYCERLCLLIKERKIVVLSLYVEVMRIEMYMVSECVMKVVLELIRLRRWKNMMRVV